MLPPMSRSSAALALAIIVLFPATTYAQVGPQPECTQRSPNKDWYRLDEVPVGGIFQTGIWALGWDRAEYSTTFYPATRRAPERADFDDEASYQAALVDRSCMYAADAATDGNLNTAWVEHAPWYGREEVMLFHYRDGSALEIFTGYAATEEYWLKNSRPRRVRLIVLEPTVYAERERDIRITAFRVAGRGEYDLEDVYGFQPLPLPPYRPATPDRLTADASRLASRYGAVPGALAALAGGDRLLFVALEILDYYRGEVWDDNAISEIRVVDG